MNTIEMCPAPDAIVLHANYACFLPGMVVNNDKVQSRMLLWCKSGKGKISVNGKNFSFSSGCFLFIPWNHEIHYQADMEDPFIVAGIHMIPRLLPGSEINYDIFHSERADLAEYQMRKDVLIPDFVTLFSSRFNESSTLAMLAEYIVTWFQWQPRAEFMARNLAQALIYELIQAKRNLAVDFDDYPLLLKKCLDFINVHIEKKVDVAMLAEHVGCVPSTIFRLFKTHLQCSPCNWILKQKVFHAMELLKKTNLPVKAIGERIGIDDPYYFCKVFKKFTGSTAGTYRNCHSLVKYNPFRTSH